MLAFLDEEEIQVAADPAPAPSHYAEMTVTPKLLVLQGKNSVIIVVIFAYLCIFSIH